MACLVQQLFRQKIGASLDPAFIDEFIFPFLFKQRGLPCFLDQDIKLAGSSIFLMYSEEDSDYDPGDGSHDGDYTVPIIEYISPFTPCFVLLQDKLRNEGKWSSSSRLRDIPPRFWGTIDIVNRYRSLKHPDVSGPLDEVIFKMSSGLAKEWISLKEVDEKEREEMVWEDTDIDNFISADGGPRSLKIYKQIEKKIIAEDVRFANDFMKKAIDNPNIHIDWSCQYDDFDTNMEHIEL
jgi:hypothetical protein